MANSLNQCNFIGSLGKDPEIRYMPNGDAVASFSLAVGWKTKDKEGTEWVPVVIYGKLAEIAGKYLKKGSSIFISGRFRTRKWADKEGKDRYTTEIIADTMQMLGGKQDSSQGNPEPASSPAPNRQQGQSQGGYGGPAPNGMGVDEFSDDIPFSPLRHTHII